ncbi:hypothetical protein GFY24_18695 [Nocardia sp. SYP-A9097]|uniref:hypothetical protein n=1 Tax=Nocardia sp. SYP-A9097 TaxID=2663237 RepID=UPI00129A5360|nr:hypothetical protein [Nocardia sp. SYP-A9097]MRH89451.1 hypothetical protein [Nocardia sp. SYP-A9097]
MIDFTQQELMKMIARIASSAALTAVVFSLGVIGASAASASEPQAKPVDGSIGFCFSIPLPGSASLYWCL